MRYMPAVLGCAGVLLVYVLLGAALGWKHGGGFVPMILLVVALALIWGAAKPKD